MPLDRSILSLAQSARLLAPQGYTCPTSTSVHHSVIFQPTHVLTWTCKGDDEQQAPAHDHQYIIWVPQNLYLCNIVCIKIEYINFSFNMITDYGSSEIPSNEVCLVVHWNNEDPLNQKWSPTCFMQIQGDWCWVVPRWESEYLVHRLCICMDQSDEKPVVSTNTNAAWRG